MGCFPPRNPMLDPARRLKAGSVPSCFPRPAREPPAGPGWIHEIKHDGFRILARKAARMLGKAKKVTIDKENTTIVNGAGKKSDIEGRVAQIKAEIEEPLRILRRPRAASVVNFTTR